MKTAELFSQVMMILWDGEEQPTREAKAIASFVKTHRVNAENALEVRLIMWPDSNISIRMPGESIAQGEIWFDVTFEDGSQCMIQADDGIGSSIEVL